MTSSFICQSPYRTFFERLDNILLVKLSRADVFSVAFSIYKIICNRYIQVIETVANEI